MELYCSLDKVLLYNVHTTVLQVWAYTILQGYGYMQPHPPQTKLKLVTLSLSILDFEKNITVEIFKYKMF